MKIRPSQRLSYRLMDEHDAKLLFQLDQNPKVMKYINGGKISSQQDIDDILMPRMLKYLNPEKGWGIWQVCLSESEEYLGWILIRPMNFFIDAANPDDLELGWRFFEKNWGKGYATEAAKHLMQNIAQITGVKTYSAIAVKENHASIAIMKKLGMRYQKSGIHKDPLGDWQVDYYQLRLQD